MLRTRPLEQQIRNQDAAGGGRIPGDSVSARVVIVGGSRELRLGLRWLLENDGRFAVTGEAEDAASFLDSTSWREADVVLVDLLLQDRDGFALVDAVGRVANRPAFVLLGPVAVPYLRAEARRCGAADLLDKRRDLDVLPDRLGELLGLPPSARDTADTVDEWSSPASRSSWS